MKNPVQRSILFTLPVLFSSLCCIAQETLSLEQCLELAKTNYPQARQAAIIAESGELKTRNLDKLYYPQLSIQGQASYQSDVTALPISLPGVKVPELSKDQYRIYAELNQAIYDGGNSKQLKTIQQLSQQAEKQNLDAEMYKLNERVTQLFFGILLCESQMRQVSLLEEDLKLNAEKIASAVKNGVSLPSNLDILLAEKLKAGQKQIELRMLRKNQLYALGILTGRELGDSVKLREPQERSVQPGSRPELRFIDAQQRNLAAQMELLGARSRPRLNFFVQGGYGRPALNMLNNSFQTYYIGGLRLQWNLSGLYTLRNEKQALRLGMQSLSLQKETFLFNNKLLEQQQTLEMTKLVQLIEGDSEIVELRKKISRAAAAQLEQGTITSSDYLRERHAEEQAAEQQALHRIQLLAAQHQAQYLAGETNQKTQ